MTFSYSDRKKEAPLQNANISAVPEDAEILTHIITNPTRVHWHMARAGGLTGSYFLNVHLTDWGRFISLTSERPSS